LNAQRSSGFQNKYSYQLPDVWKGKSRTLMKINNLVQHLVPELKDKQECINCNADYFIKFFIFPPFVQSVTNKTATSEFIVLFTFSAFMDVYNVSTGSLMKRVLLSTPDTVYSHTTMMSGIEQHNPNYFNQIRQIAAIRERMSSPSYNSANMTTDLARIENLNEATNKVFDAHKYIKDNKSSFIPPDYILWNKVEEIIASVKTTAN
jgi:hypothetical protein